MSELRNRKAAKPGTQTTAKPTAKPTTRRRDDDPVRVFADHRVAHWTGGLPNVGERKFLRHRTDADAQATAAALRAGYLEQLSPRTGKTWTDTMRAFVESMEKDETCVGTLRQYRSNWNRHLVEVLYDVRCDQTSIVNFTAITASLTAKGAHTPTITAVIRTLGALVTFAELNGYITTSEPFGSKRLRKEAVGKAKTAAERRAKKEAARIAAELAQQGLVSALDAESIALDPDKISLEMCPTRAEVEQYAAAFEKQYPGYGERLVLLAYASGLRICELLALRVEHVRIDDESTTLSVVVQLDRYQPWPAVALPKGDEPRVAIVWDAYRDVLISLVEDARSRELENGWLFPRTHEVASWADHLGHLATAAAREAGWDWSFHWLRHAFASVCLAPESAGGYGLDLASVQKWLGHKDETTTMNQYVVRQRGDHKHAKAHTSHKPGYASGLNPGRQPARHQARRAGEHRAA